MTRQLLKKRKNRRPLIKLLAVSIICFGCRPDIKENYREKEGNGLKLDSTHAGAVETERFLLYDGNSIGFVEYKNGVKNGFTIIYYKKGSIKSKTEYVDGLRSGYDSTYYENGNLEGVINWHKGKQFGNSVFYRENGKLELYNCYDFKERNVYVVKYDSVGRIINKYGWLIGHIIGVSGLDTVNLSNRPDTVRLKDTYEISCCVAAPPETTSYLFLWYGFNRKENKTRLEIKNNKATFYPEFKKQGKYVFEFVCVNLPFSKKENYTTQTFEQNVIVIE